MSAPDDWQKPRGYNGHLSPAEVDLVKQQYIRGARSSDVARELKCSSRTITRYFGLLKAEGVARARPSRAGEDCKPAPAPPAPRPSRFYKSDFEL